MLNPTCPQCQHPIVAHDAMLVMGQVAIWLQCDNGHDTVDIFAADRFTDNPLKSAELDYLFCQINEYELADRLELSYTVIGAHIMGRGLNVKRYV